MKKTTPLARTALVVGANLPDLDLLWSGPGLGYIVYHRGVTHSVVGAATGALLLFGGLMLVDRSAGRRPDRPRARPLWLLLASMVGVGSHVLLDAANGYGWRPWLPWDPRWIYGDLWVIVDPWVWLLLGGVVFLTGRRRLWTDALWVTAAAAATGLLLLVPGLPAGSRAAWLVGLCLLALTRKAAPLGGRGSETIAARTALLGLALYAAASAVSHGLALGRLRELARAELPRAGIVSMATLPRPADPLRWDGFLETPEAVYYRAVGVVPALDPPGEPFVEFPRRFEDRAVRLVIESCAGRAALSFFRFPFATIEEESAGSWVVLRDARYARSGRGPFGVLRVPLAPDGTPRLEGIRCPRGTDG